MAQLPNKRGFPFNLQPVVMTQQQFPRNVGNLKGSGPRRAIGSLIIACGCAQIVVTPPIIIVLQPRGFYYGHWGIWNVVVAIITGSFGLASARNRSMVSILMILAIIATLLCVISMGFQATIAVSLRRYYGLQFLFCIIGASFTCVALSDVVPQQRVIVNPPYAMPPGQANVASPYTGVVNMAMQPAPGNGGSVNDDPPSYQVAVADDPPSYQVAIAQPKI